MDISKLSQMPNNGSDDNPENQEGHSKVERYDMISLSQFTYRSTHHTLPYKLLNK